MIQVVRSAEVRSQQGYALVLVMVALVTLTILGVSSITAAQLDMKITQNMRHHKQLQYGGLTGLDHARDLTEDLVFDGFSAFNDAMFSASHCTTGWISAAAGAVAAPVALKANGWMMADYSTDLCAGTCGQPPAGFDAERYFSYSIDIVATGAMPNATADAQVGSFLFRVEQAEGGGCQ
jgi:hypothetical protein